MRRLFGAAGAAWLLAAAFDAGAGVTLANAWTRPVAAGEDAAVYVDIRSTERLTLVGGSSPLARSVDVVEARPAGDRIEMVVVPTFPIAADRETRFAFRGNMLRLTAVKAPLANGTPVPLTLEFLDAAGKNVTVATTVEVRGLVARGAPAPGAPPAPVPEPGPPPRI